MKIYLLLVLILLSISTKCFAGGAELFPLNRAKTLSLDGLYFAGFDGIVNSIMNPASIMFIDGNGVEFSASDRLSQNELESSSNGLFRSLRNDEYIINGGFYLSLSKYIKAGISYQPSINYNIEWPYANVFNNDSSSSIIIFDFYNRLKVEAISPSVAFRFDNIVFGIAPVAYKFMYKTAFPKTNPAWNNFNAAGYQFEYSLDGWAYGVSMGAIAQINPDMKLALSLRSGFSSTLKGNANSKMFADLDSTASNVNVSNKIEIPWIFGVGALYALSSELSMNLDIQYSLWGSVQKSINYSFDNSIWQSGLSVTDQLTGITGSTFNLSYRNTFDFGIGLEYIPEGNFNYRFGYKFSQSPNQNSTFNMLFPAGDQHWISAGFGLSEEDFDLDGTVAYAIGFSKNINSGVVSSINGKYSYNVIIPTVSIKYKIR